MKRRVTHPQLVFACAIVLGLIVTGGLAMLFRARDSAVKTCIITMTGEPPGIMANVLRLCAERYRVALPDRQRVGTIPKG
jgi:hypothetical protein